MDDNDVPAGSDRPERAYQPRDYRYSIIFYSVFGLLGIFWIVRGITKATVGDADDLDIAALIFAALMVVGSVVYLANVLRLWRKSRR
jgi:predicted membrane channel-forming protein YqfA (hemolysin III family)